MTEFCAYLHCPKYTPATTMVYVFMPGGHYPLFVCSDEHFEGLKEMGAENGAEVVRAKV